MILLCTLAFLSGGYLIPGTIHFINILRLTSRDKSLSGFECFMTALTNAAIWPFLNNEWLDEDAIPHGGNMK